MTPTDTHKKNAAASQNHDDKLAWLYRCGSRCLHCNSILPTKYDVPPLTPCKTCGYCNELDAHSRLAALKIHPVEETTETITNMDGIEEDITHLFYKHRGYHIEITQYADTRYNRHTQTAGKYLIRTINQDKSPRSEWKGPFENTDFALAYFLECIRTKSMTRAEFKKLEQNEMGRMIEGKPYTVQNDRWSGGSVLAMVRLVG